MLKKASLLAVLWMAGGTLAGACQESIAPKVPAFEVISVRPADPRATMGRSLFTPTGISVVNCSLLMLLRQAYELYNSNDDQLTGLPAWAKTQKFDMEAKVSEADTAALKTATRTVRSEMLRELLVERFHLAAHRDTRELPVYALLLAKHGAKLVASTPGETAGNGLPRTDARAGDRMIVGNGHLEAYGTGLDSLASSLTQETGRTVVNRTGLTGVYDFKLDWTPEERTDAAAVGAPPNLFTALEEQLGLRLESQKGPVQGVVVEHVEKPSEN